MLLIEIYQTEVVKFGATRNWYNPRKFRYPEENFTKLYLFRSDIEIQKERISPYGGRNPAFSRR